MALPMQQMPPRSPLPAPIPRKRRSNRPRVSLSVVLFIVLYLLQVMSSSMVKRSSADEAQGMHGHRLLYDLDVPRPCHRIRASLGMRSSASRCSALTSQVNERPLSSELNITATAYGSRSGARLSSTWAWRVPIGRRRRQPLGCQELLEVRFATNVAANGRPAHISRPRDISKADAVDWALSCELAGSRQYPLTDSHRLHHTRRYTKTILMSMYYTTCCYARQGRRWMHGRAHLAGALPPVV